MEHLKEQRVKVVKVPGLQTVKVVTFVELCMEMVVNRINTRVSIWYTHHLVISCPLVICAGKRP